MGEEQQANPLNSCSRDQEGPVSEQKFGMRVKLVFRTEQMAFPGVQRRKVDEVLT